MDGRELYRRDKIIFETRLWYLISRLDLPSLLSLHPSSRIFHSNQTLIYFRCKWRGSKEIFFRRDFDTDLSRWTKGLGHVVVVVVVGPISPVNRRVNTGVCNSGENTWKRRWNPGVHPARFINLDIYLGNPMIKIKGDRSKINTRRKKTFFFFFFFFSNTFLYEIVLRFSTFERRK